MKGVRNAAVTSDNAEEGDWVRIVKATGRGHIGHSAQRSGEAQRPVARAAWKVDARALGAERLTPPSTIAVHLDNALASLLVCQVGTVEALEEVHALLEGGFHG